MPNNACVLVRGEQKCELRIVRHVNKTEVGLVAQYCRLLSSDKLVEALAGPLITPADYDIIIAELDRRMQPE